MTKTRRSGGDAAARQAEERKDFRAYASGIALALVLTLVSFALVRWAVVPGLPRSDVIGTLALVQMVVHFRCFLHIGWRERREDLLLILFSALLLSIMVAGTLWIMASLALRMAVPAML